ncbi:MAG: flagellar hook-associated protein FlgL [Deltaproteobacteria bacterium]|nr:flagellar hook-associated protein FlgL [Deltaproteobacteria bacterium]MBW2019137.1 flagellar hook-associated protein FlgL [Deltaproteobacteria bacterium]MBW2073204.1 flagellar hook-associated protein FlgL [Deltaproteobacteria bacterium]
MRVANKTIYEAITFNLGNITEDLSHANKVVATGKRIINLSDDPTGLTQGLHIKSSLSNIEQLGRNITLGKSWLRASESALTNVQDMISDTKSLCVQMATATMSAAARASAAQAVQNTLEEIVSLANTEVSGRYIFAGSKTDTAPFSQDGTYNGDNNAFTVKIGRDATVEVGSDGEAVFQPSGAGANDDIFQTLSDLKTALENNDVSGIQDAISKLDAHLDHISEKISDIGSKMVRTEIKENLLQDMSLTNTERLSNIEDADITEAIMDLKAKELAYQAALTAAAKVLNISLVDYLK